MSNYVNFFVFFIFLKILLVSTQDNFTFLITGGYRPREHTLVKYMVSLQDTIPHKFFGSEHFCGGSILTPQIILTAAHCVWDKKLQEQIDEDDVEIIARTPNRLKRTAQTEVIEVKDIILHPNYAKKGTNDIAILHLKSNISEDGVYAKVIEPTDGPVKLGKKCTVVGWGRVFEGGPFPANALYTDIYILENKNCLRFSRFTDGMLCAGDVIDVEKDACFGDSGGPLICDGKFTGVVSFGWGCGEYPGVYADVWYNRDWIFKESKVKIGKTKKKNKKKNKKKKGKNQESGKSTKSFGIFNVFLLQLLVWIVKLYLLNIKLN